MWSNDYDRGVPKGTFEVGDVCYRINSKTHMFRLKRDCPYCNKKGTIEYIGTIFKCPKCEGKTDLIEVEEKIVEKPYVIKSKCTMSNTVDSREIYYTDNFLGIVICKSSDGIFDCYKTNAGAQQECDKWNKENSTYEKLKEYEKRVFEESNVNLIG